ncbi:NAD(P)H-dependent flavin oxidoreductase [Humibacillus xanthopallidus]|uniref:Nitronate monooxygenase n=1 Tax=Humibacillus xanthopallidus TaxID=412689 RepID=A0A543HVD4_9MICO|nr:nitronate monooxygenase [Humibacillus xanthopallidus]TQM62250.1 nitronate monooxygenase [Humibacillus xanthopallidus]
MTRDELLDALRLPVVAAPMFLVSGTELVVAAARAGVLGAFPTQNCRTAEQLDEWLATISAGVGGRPWAVNLVTHSSNTRLADDLRLVGEYRPPVVITALGSPRPVMEVVKGYGGLVVGDVVSIALARKAVAAGVDGLACISAGAGGHTGHLSPFAFVSAVRDFFDGIVTVGGGIADGRGVAGAVAAGADLVYMGTRFLASLESLAPDAYKKMVVDHGPDDLVVSAGITGTAASWLRPSLLANGLDPDHLVHEGSRSYDAAQAPAARWSQLWAAGQGLQSIHGVQPVAEIVDELEAEYAAAAERFARLTHRTP